MDGPEASTDKAGDVLGSCSSLLQHRPRQTLNAWPLQDQLQMASIRRKSLRVSAVINQLDLNLDEVHGVLAPFKGSVEGSAKGCVASFGIVEGNVCNRGLGLRVQGIPSRCWFLRVE